MSLLTQFYEAKLELAQKEEELVQKEGELEQLKEEYSSYRKIVESTTDNKRIRSMREHVSWMSRDELKKRAKEIEEEEWIEGCLEKARRERIRSRREEERSRREEEKKKEAN